jgi:SPP1 gp7 family putative phage head morphogenesis protein
MYIMDAPKKKPTVPIKKNPSPFQKGKGPMTTYERALRGVAREVGKLINGYAPTDTISSQSLSQALKGYADLIGPWALFLVSNVLRAIDNQDMFAWLWHSKDMSVALRKEIKETDTGTVMKDLMKQNVLLIKSIPIQAAERVHKLVQENMMVSARSSEIAKKIMETEGVTKSRATLIARTEVSKASTALTMSRALQIGSTGYVWRTVGDMIVRPSHKKMNGKFVKWDSPVTLDNMTGHAGGFPNCRCFCDPEIPDR